MKVYVSAKFNDKDRVRDTYVSLQNIGHTITHEWIHNKQSFPFDQDPAFTAKCAQEDFNGVLDADVFILFSNADPSMGASGELGAAIASSLLRNKPDIYVIGPYFNANFCFYHPHVQLKNNLEEVIAAIQRNQNNN